MFEHSGRYVRLSDLIIEEVADKHRISANELETSARSRKLAPARQEAMYELRRRTKLSTPQIAARLGLKDHASVIHGSDVHAVRFGLPRISSIRAAAEAERVAA